MSRRERAILVGPAYLTEREAEALTLLAQGKTTQEIAEDMGNKWTTVNESLKAIYRKIGARNRAVAGVLAAKAGLV